VNREAALAVGIPATGVLLRLLWIHFFPTVPASDFANVVAFAEAFARDPAATGFGFWDMLNPGTSLFLSFALRTGIGSPAAASRLVTAVFVGLLPLLPFLIWRGVLPLWARVAAALSLAVWPGQIAFSGVVAQDNWAIGPTVALACLACRTVLGRPPHPWLSGLLLGIAFLVRQEMIVVLAPLALAGAGVLPGRTGRRHDAVVLAGTLAACLLFAASLRGAGSGRFGITTTHGGISTLAAAVPGSSRGYCAPPYSYVETFAPGQDPKRVAWRLTWYELARRPFYHAVRVVYFALAPVLRTSSGSLYWSLSPAFLPEGDRANAAQALRFLQRPLEWEMYLVLFAGFAALVVAARTRNLAVLLLAAAAMIKACVHALTVSQPRYFMPMVALILLAVPITLATAERPSRRRLLLGAGFVALPFTAAIAVAARVTEQWTQRHDAPISYRFEIPEPSGQVRFACVTENAGRWSWFPELTEKTLSFFDPDPSPGEVAGAVCDLRDPAAVREATLRLSVPSSFAGQTGRFMLTVTSNGVAKLQADVGALVPGQPVEVRLPLEDNPRVAVRLQALSPEPGWGWGHALRVGLSVSTQDVGGPTITETSPREVRAGVAFNVQPTGEAALAVIGRGFEPGDVIVWNEVVLATTHANSGLLTAIVPARLYETPGRAMVRVRSAGRAITIVP
jgi:hypothetical protein